MSPRRGEVWYVDLDPVEGHEQGRRRPALVLSVDSFNASRAELVTVLPITSKLRPGNPFRVSITPPEGGVTTESSIICEQSRTISTRRLEKRLGVVRRTTMDEIAEHVRMLLGL